jgi:hypothetical protein
MNDESRDGPSHEPSVNEPEFSIADSVAFQRRLQSDPDSVNDDEIRAEYGEDIDPQELRRLIGGNTFGREPRDKRASVRAKLRRRLFCLSRSLDEVEHAVTAVLQAPGRTYKREELERLLAAIDHFRSGVKLPPSEPVSDVAPDLFERLLSGSHLGAGIILLPSDLDQET